MDLNSFFQWLVTGAGSLVAAGVFVAYVLSKIQRWNELDHDLKTVVTIAIAVGISFVSQALLNLGVTGDPRLVQLFGLLVYYLSNQVSFTKLFAKNKSVKA